jgi:hypothetical protein
MNNYLYEICANKVNINSSFGGEEEQNIFKSVLLKHILRPFLTLRNNGDILKHFDQS